MKERLLSYFMVFGVVFGVIVFVYSYKTMQEAKQTNASLNSRQNQP